MSLRIKWNAERTVNCLEMVSRPRLKKSNRQLRMDLIPFLSTMGVANFL